MYEPKTFIESLDKVPSMTPSTALLILKTHLVNANIIYILMIINIVFVLIGMEVFTALFLMRILMLEGFHEHENAPISFHKGPHLSV